MNKKQLKIQSPFHFQTEITTGLQFFPNDGNFSCFLFLKKVYESNSMIACKIFALKIFPVRTAASLQAQSTPSFSALTLQFCKIQTARQTLVDSNLTMSLVVNQKDSNFSPYSRAASEYRVVITPLNVALFLINKH